MKTTKLTPEQKEANKIARKEARGKAKELARIQKEKDQKHVKSITISIEWRKSSAWGNCPHASAVIEFKDNSLDHIQGYKVGGCGYDKESTVMGEVFNDYLKYKLWNLSEEAIKGGNGSNDNGSAPYGIHYTKREDYEGRYFGQGIGVNCFYRIAEYLGGKFAQIASGKTFDVYKYTDNSEE